MQGRKLVLGKQAMFSRTTKPYMQSSKMEVAVNLAQEQGQLRAEMRLWSTFDVAGTVMDMARVSIADNGIIVVANVAVVCSLRDYVADENIVLTRLIVVSMQIK